jgi:hypothetical protein
MMFVQSQRCQELDAKSYLSKDCVYLSFLFGFAFDDFDYKGVVFWNGCYLKLWLKKKKQVVLLSQTSLRLLKSYPITCFYSSLEGFGLQSFQYDVFL